MFTVRDLQARIRQRPFRPFRIVTSSGECVAVTHPELVILGESWVHVARPSRKDPGVGESIVEVARLHISMLEELPSQELPSEGLPRPS